MKRTYEEKSRQLITSVKPTTLNLQPRDFAPPQSELDENVSSQTSKASSENLLEKLISTPTSKSSAASIQRKSQNRLKAIRSQGTPIQAKLNIGEPNDKYEKEADDTASKVVQQINSLTHDNSVQKQESMEAEDEELQMKPAISKIQRDESMEEEDEELQMKSLVQRRENFDGGEASTDLESSIQSARGSGQSLDAGLQAKMGQAMGADFSDVKVHTDSLSDQLSKSIQAKAFTTGQDVFFRQGAYAPSSRGGQELIAHELTHVVQQRGVPKSNHRKLVPDQNAQVEASMSQDPSSRTIQRIMDLPTFTEKTTLFGQGVFKRPRNRITQVDNSLTAYRGVSTDVANIAAKEVAATNLITECSTYLNLPDGNRKKGVRKLKQQAEDEKAVIDPLADSIGKPLTRQFELVSQAQDLQINLNKEGRIDANPQFVSFDTWLVPLINLIRQDPVAKQQVLQNELDALENIRQAPNTDPLLQQILAEILANHQGNSTVVPSVGSPMAKMVDKTDPTQGYEVHHNLNAPLGTAERLGSLTHELTHVSVSNIFQNSGLFLAFKTGATDNQILNLSARRTQQCKDLKKLADKSKLFDGNQKMLLNNKITYPYDGSKGDITRYIKPANIDITSPLALRIKNLATQGLNNTVIEFDTVINQMMMYMHEWQVPATNPFYARLKVIAQEAYTHRHT